MTQAKLLLSRHFIKINAYLIGYGLWILLSQHHVITARIIVPVCFYNIPEQCSITGQDTAILIVTASKKALHRFDIYNSAIHLDAAALTPGTHNILLKKENLFLPDEINLVNLVPSFLQINVYKAGNA